MGFDEFRTVYRKWLGEIHSKLRTHQQLKRKFQTNFE